MNRNTIAITRHPNGNSISYVRINAETMEARWNTGHREQMPISWMEGMLVDIRHIGGRVQDFRS